MTPLRHGAMGRLFTGTRAPSALGTFLRSLTSGHVRQINAVASRLLINLAGRIPLVPGAEELGYVDVDDTLRQTYGYARRRAPAAPHEGPERAAPDRLDPQPGALPGQPRKVSRATLTFGPLWWTVQ